jgi:hypothetical protein
MSLSAAIIDALVESGVTAEQMAAVIKASLAEDEDRREKKRAGNAARQAKHRKKNNASNALPDVTERDTRDGVSPNEYISNPHPDFDVSNETSAVSDFSEIVVEAWNRDTDGSPLPKARKLTPDRRKHLAARAREHGRDAVLAAIRNMAASDFHSGRTGQWTEGNLGWLLKSPENFVKMLERSPPATTVSSLPRTPGELADAKERTAKIYDMQGRTNEAEELRQEAERLRQAA